MDKIVIKLKEDGGGVVLDLGSSIGSLSRTNNLLIIYADVVIPVHAPFNFVCCNAACLPFLDHSITAIILNHSLEHFDNLSACIIEIARVIAERGYIYIAIPDATTVSDRLYRWLGGADHVNLFPDVHYIPQLITQATGLPLAGIRVLYTSLSFLNRYNLQGRIQRKLWLVGGGYETVLRWLTFAFRWIDRLFKTRLSIYGWSYYFGFDLDINELSWSNVCIRCGAGHSAAFLKEKRLVIHRRFQLRVYHCPHCGTKNFYTD